MAGARLGGMARLAVTWRADLARAAFACAVAACVQTACSVDARAVCAPGDHRYCKCGEAGGYQQCSADGAGYGVCDCSGRVPPGAGILVEAGVPEAAVEAGAAAGFLAPCVVNEDCISGNCFEYNAFGPHCTHACTSDVQCEAPSPGCSNKGVCKLH